MEKGSVEGAYWSVWLLILIVKLVEDCEEIEASGSPSWGNEGMDVARAKEWQRCLKLSLIWVGLSSIWAWKLDPNRTDLLKVSAVVAGNWYEMKVGWDCWLMIWAEWSNLITMTHRIAWLFGLNWWNWTVWVCRVGLIWNLQCSLAAELSVVKSCEPAEGGRAYGWGASPAW